VIEEAVEEFLEYPASVAQQIVVQFFSKKENLIMIIIMI
jgi:hypothetical protein